MNLRSGHRSTSAGVDLGDNGRGEDNDHTNGDSHEAPLLAPPPPPPPPMTHVEMMEKMLAARCESAHALEMLAQAIGGFALEAPVATVGTGWCTCSHGALFLLGLPKDTPAHVHANC